MISVRLRFRIWCNIRVRVSLRVPVQGEEAYVYTRVIVRFNDWINVTSRVMVMFAVWVWAWFRFQVRFLM